MTTDHRSAAAPPSSTAIRATIAAAGAGLAAAVLALGAGLAFLAFDPAEGSALERALAVVAAAGGIASALLIALALGLAQLSGAWALVPARLRYAATAALVVAAIAAAIAR